MATFDWQLQARPADAVNQLAADLAVPPFLARLLLERGITTKEALDNFCNPDVGRLNDPLLLHDMDKAVARITQAIERGEKITIYGDYDVDGLTASSIMLETLQSIGAEPEVFIPDRFTDGYGPNQDVYDYLQKTGTQLVITVDNGVGGAAVIDKAMASGMDVVVTDHHELPAVLPKAVAVVHPRHPDGHYPFGDLSGAGVAFKVATALLGEPPLESIDLAALGTIADLVGMTDENRVIVQLGLRMIRSQPRIGLAALLQASGIDAKTVDETSVSFGIAPRLNALGRLGEAKPGVTLLTTFDEDEAAALAHTVNELNTQRQALVKQIADEALAMATTPANQQAKTLVLAKAGWHEGVLGIVASHVVEETGKPTLVLNIQEDGKTAKGSGRSIEAYHLFNALNAAKDEMTHFGGHHMAVGLTVPVANLPALHEAMEQAGATTLTDVPRPTLTLAGQVDARDLTLANYQLIRQLAPYGPGNEEPVFSFLPHQLGDIRQLGKTGAHLKFQADGLNVIAFGRGQDASALSHADQAKLAVCLGQNTWQGNTTLQLQLKDWQLSAPSVIDMRLPKPSGEQFRGAYTYVFFDAKHKQTLTSQYFFGGPVVMAQDVTAPLANAVLVDLPDTDQQLATLAANLTAPVRVIFTAPAAKLVALPTREEFGRVLRFLQGHPGFDKHHLPALAREVHLTVQQVIFAVQVFFELGFVTIEGALITVVAAPARRALNTATVYQAREAFLALAQHLQTDDRASLAKRLLLE